MEKILEPMKEKLEVVLVNGFKELKGCLKEWKIVSTTTIAVV